MAFSGLLLGAIEPAELVSVFSGVFGDALALEGAEYVIGPIILGQVFLVGPDLVPAVL